MAKTNEDFNKIIIFSELIIIILKNTHQLAQHHHLHDHDCGHRAAHNPHHLFHLPPPPPHHHDHHHHHHHHDNEQTWSCTVAEEWRWLGGSRDQLAVWNK